MTARAIILLAAVLTGVAQAQSLERISRELTSSVSETEPISVVREAALRETASVIGARAGLFDRSCEIQSVLEAKKHELDHNFRFNSLLMGRGMLPPVITEARDTVSLQSTVMRVASRAYSIDEPAALVDVPPTWRNWLLPGLSVDGCGKPFVTPEVSAQMRPKTAQEKAFFEGVIKASYAAGRAQAQQVFDANLARLERTYTGMRRYFELYERGMVSAPVLVSDTEVVAMDDPNTLLVGNTVIRIAQSATFVTQPERWRPLMPLGTP